MVALQIKTSGPLFRTGLPARVMRDAKRDTMQDIVERGEQIIRGQLYPGHGLITGNYRRSIVGEVGMRIGQGAGGADRVNSAYKSSSIHDVRRDGSQGVLYDSGVVYGPWLEGVGSRNQSTRFKGYAMFRRTGRALDIAAPRLLLKHVNRAVRALNG